MKKKCAQIKRILYPQKQCTKADSNGSGSGGFKTKDDQTILGSVCVRVLMCMRLYVCVDGWDIFQRKKEKQKNWNYRLNKAASAPKPSGIFIFHIYILLMEKNAWGCSANTHTLTRGTRIEKPGERRGKAENHSQKKAIDWALLLFFPCLFLLLYGDGRIKRDFLCVQSATHTQANVRTDGKKSLSFPEPEREFTG